jgi:hypothetical protein
MSGIIPAQPGYYVVQKYSDNGPRLSHEPIVGWVFIQNKVFPVTITKVVRKPHAIRCPGNCTIVIVDESGRHFRHDDHKLLTYLDCIDLSKYGA